MWAWDPNGCCLQHALFAQQATLSDWMTQALRGTLTIPSWTENPDQIAHAASQGPASA